MIETTLLVFVVAFAGWNAAIHAYTQLVTYALFSRVADVAGGAGFVDYHRAYQRQLPAAVYAPWAVLTLVSAALVFARPEGLPLWIAIVLLVLNASIAPVSLAFAAPVHRRIDRDGALDVVSAGALLRWNAVRLCIAVASLVLTVIAAILALG